MYRIYYFIVNRNINCFVTHWHNNLKVQYFCFLIGPNLTEFRSQSLILVQENKMNFLTNIKSCFLLFFRCSKENLPNFLNYRTRFYLDCLYLLYKFYVLLKLKYQICNKPINISFSSNYFESFINMSRESCANN